jgi:hypothetical protein
MSSVIRVAVVGKSRSEKILTCVNKAQRTVVSQAIHLAARNYILGLYCKSH